MSWRPRWCLFLALPLGRACAAGYSRGVHQDVSCLLAVPTLGSCCRAGADFVTGAEVSQHMCDLAAETVIHNGYGTRCIMVRPLSKQGLPVQGIHSEQMAMAAAEGVLQGT